ncbi:MAG: hypothetical protein VW008_04550 [Aquiluna sp.]
MKKTLAAIAALFLIVSFATPAQSAGAKYSVYQKTLSAFSSTATTLTAQQKAQVKAAVDANPAAEKFICTGIRYYSQPMSVNIMVRKRAKAACEYAKQLNPNLSTWYQNKPTQARSYAGKVLLTVKSPQPKSVASPSSVDLCKVPDGRPEALQGFPRGAYVNGEQVRGSIGFPLTVGRFPILGEANIVAAMVSFTDTDEFVDSPTEFLGPQTEKITEWSRYWSQGQFRYNFQIVENWIRLPIKSSEASSNDEVLGRMILDLFPAGIDYSKVDGTFIYWAPGLDGVGHDFGLRVGSNENPFVMGEKRPGLFWAPSDWHYQDTGGENGIKFETKKEYTWSYWIHEFLHEQGLNLHAPGNGWTTGLGQNQYPVVDPASLTGSNRNLEYLYSAALPAWELFLMGWIRDSQVQCITTKDLIAPQETVLTSLEIEGGERKTLVINTGDDEILVVESRRPTGYTEWARSDKGIFVYRANPKLLAQDDHSSGDCGNDPQYPKWSYYLFPDNETANPDAWCGSFRAALVQEGESVTYNGVRITLKESLSGADVVTVVNSGK